MQLMLQLILSLMLLLHGDNAPVRALAEVAGNQMQIRQGGEENIPLGVYFEARESEEDERTDNHEFFKHLFAGTGIDALSQAHLHAAWFCFCLAIQKKIAPRYFILFRNLRN